MTVGPIQLVVLGFESPDFHGAIIEEFQRLRESSTVRVIDSLVVSKDAEGHVSVLSGTNLTSNEQAEFGGYVATLLGLDESEDDFDNDNADAAEELGEMLEDDDLWDVIDEIPPDTAAALLLLDHQWAVPLRDAVRRAGGSLVAEGFVSPLDLVDIGLLVEAEAELAEWP